MPDQYQPNTLAENLNLIMDIFSWLLVGHLIGDWLFQNDWMVRGKKQGIFTLAGTIHFTIYTAAIIGAFWLAGVRDKPPTLYLTIGAFVYISHWLIDATKITEYWIHFFRQSDLPMMRVMVDQIFHIFVLVGITINVGLIIGK